MFRFHGAVRLFAFDLDGTLYLGDDPVPGGPELVAYLHNHFQVAYFTNNSSRTEKDIHAKLNRMGYAGALSEVYTSSSSAAAYLAGEGLDHLYAIGSAGFRQVLVDHGLHLAEADNARHVVVGLDPGFHYDQISGALAVLRRGGRFIACNEDPWYPVGPDRVLPGCGALVGAIAGAALRRPDFVVGKPNPYILSLIARAHGVRPEEIVVVGDTLESDIAMAQAFGSRAIWFGGQGPAPDDNVIVMDRHAAILDLIKEEKT